MYVYVLVFVRCPVSELDHVPYRIRDKHGIIGAETYPDHLF